jgi:hypothetical protein
MHLPPRFTAVLSRPVSMSLPVSGAAAIEIDSALPAKGGTHGSLIARSAASVLLALGLQFVGDTPSPGGRRGE